MVFGSARGLVQQAGISPKLVCLQTLHQILSWGHKCLVGPVTICMHAAFSGSCVAGFKQLPGERQSV